MHTFRSQSVIYVRSQGSGGCARPRRNTRARARTYREPRGAGGVERGETRVFYRAILKPRVRRDRHVARVVVVVVVERRRRRRRDLRELSDDDGCGRRAVATVAIARGGARARDRVTRGRARRAVAIAAGRRCAARAVARRRVPTRPRAFAIADPAPQLASGCARGVGIGRG